MAKAKAADEAKIPMEKEKQAMGRPEKKMPTVKDTLPEGEKAPKDSGEKKMGGVHKGSTEHEMSTHIGHAGMGHAVKHLERETERGAHTAKVCGEMAHEHSGKMGKG